MPKKKNNLSFNMLSEKNIRCMSGVMESMEFYFIEVPEVSKNKQTTATTTKRSLQRHPYGHYPIPSPSSPYILLSNFAHAQLLLYAQIAINHTEAMIILSTRYRLGALISPFLLGWIGTLEM